MDTGQRQRVICVRCGHIGTHVTGAGPRLRARKCGTCAGRARPLWWVLKYRDRAISELTPDALATADHYHEKARRRARALGIS